MSFFHARGNLRIYNAIVPFHSLNTRPCIGNSSSSHIALLSATNHVFYFNPQLIHRGKKTKSSFNFNDLPHALDLRPLESLRLERSIIKNESVERASLEYSEDVQDLPQEPEPAAPASQRLLNSSTLKDFGEDRKKEKLSRRAKRMGSLPQGLITLDAESSDVQESPSIGGKKVKKAQASSEVELLQGLLPLEPLEIEHEPPPYPTVIMQARSNMLKFENCVVVTRVGGFYELYFEHAVEYAPLLGLKIAQKKTNAGPVSMAGFPFHQLDRYLKILVQDLNRYVAISEEFPHDLSEKVKSGGLMHDRRVSRIVTPGTLIDEGFMDPLSNNYVLAIHVQQDETAEAVEHESHHKSIGLAWLDLSTGHFFTQQSSLLQLPSFLARVAPREIVLAEEMQSFKSHQLFTILTDEHHIITYVTPSGVKPISEWTPMLESAVSPSSADAFSEEEVSAGSCLLQYVETRLQSTNMKLQPPVRQLNVMGIDKNTMRALEIKKTIKDDTFSGSLLHTIRRTVTKGGARLLENWLGKFALSSPSTSLDVINSRLDVVTYMLEVEPLRERMITLLKRSHDSHRLLQKFAFGRGDGDDLLDLASTIFATRDLAFALEIQNATSEPCIQELLARIHLKGPMELAQAITDAIDEDGLVQQHRIEEGESGEMQALAEAIVASEGTTEETSILRKSRKKPANSIREYYNPENEAWIMKSTATPTLKHLHEKLSSLSDQKAALAASLCDRLGATSLTLRFTPGLGHICHVKGKDVDLNMPEARTISSSKSTRSLHHPEWSSLGQEIDQCRIHIRAEEQRLFYKLRELAITNLIKLRRNATVLDEIDIACSFATLADERGWTRPILNTSSAHKIISGRHPTVETGLEEEGRSFISNDCLVGDVHRAWLITGPNMAGKSTFLRQNALITVLAQVGSYVPAEYAELGIVDHIFSRVGSADNLYQDQSTFMVEMLESAMILKNATSRSFVIMDEIGRGTTPTDGVAVAFACLHHLYHVNKCRALFATHFHALVDLIEEGDMDAMGFYCTDVEEDGGDVDGAFRYMYKLKEGINKQSHALKVAKLAGLPREAIEVARQVLGKDINF